MQFKNWGNKEFWIAHGWGVMLAFILIFIVSIILGIFIQKTIIKRKGKDTRGVIHRDELLKVKRLKTLIVVCTFLVLTIFLGGLFFKVGDTVASKLTQTETKFTEYLRKDDKIKVDNIQGNPDITK